MLNFSLVLTATLAGAAGGSHCIGMCGGIATVLARPAGKIIPITPVSTERSGWLNLIQLHLGRLLTYAFAGALVGTLGAAGLLLKPVMPVQSLLFFIGNLSLIYLGLRCLGLKLSLPGFIRRSVNVGRLSRIFSSVRLPRGLLARGLLWGCLPCGLVYGVLPLALVSGAPWSGAALMFCFGLGTVPWLLFAHGLTARFGANRKPTWLVVAAAIILIGLGCLGLFLPNEHHNAGWWC